MQMDRIYPGAAYAYSTRTGKGWQRLRASLSPESYAPSGIYKVIVRATNVERWSASTGKYRQDGVRIEFVDRRNASVPGENLVSVVPTVRIKEPWSIELTNAFAVPMENQRQLAMKVDERLRKRDEQRQQRDVQQQQFEERKAYLETVFGMNGIQSENVRIDMDGEVVFRVDGVEELLKALM